ncbi:MULTISPECIES: ribonuclease T [Legionella]|uniref:Ribonuclease T n=1 Tax=Legionella steelei TaxID=947033 RepID=A0A0W0ZKH2_9GAMM|nr:MULTISPECIES: ribonuclease T [Legionella]KTD69514.1 ribonuclease T [Legionella steelei]MBN9227067.1 ribonuclease T [Legionella steelei]OJW07367.1 MAG: ribonuclease T [Legionella sp. 39-23]
MGSHDSLPNMNLKERFRGFLPVVVDVETAGVDPSKNALLEMCIVLVFMDKQGNLHRGERYFEHILPFPGAELDQKSLEFNQIDPYQPLRFAIDEKTALENLFKPIFTALKKTQCQRAVLVGHNAWFDLLFIKEAIKRTGVKSPFHAFTCFDTATLGGFIYGQTVLAKAVQAAGIQFNAQEAHSAIYDAEVTADLFCHMANKWKVVQEVDKKNQNALD